VISNHFPVASHLGNLLQPIESFAQNSLDSVCRNLHTMRVGAIPLAKFEECLQRLEKIVQELEKGEVPLEKSLTLFEEGMQLSSACRKELEQAEGKVEILLKQNGKLQAEPFEPATEKVSARR
jgi:exodeoxyribonuclease VII small subunit